MAREEEWDCHSLISNREKNTRGAMFDAYTLIANHLEDIYHNLTEKIAKDKKNAPKWTVLKVAIREGKEEEMIVDELSPLLGLIQTLKGLASHHVAQSPEEN